jgi:hypothetical protein
MGKLAELANELKASIRSQQKIDISGEVSYDGILKTYRKHKLEVDLYKTFLSVTISANSSLAFAINQPDRMFGYRVPLQLADSPYPVYVAEQSAEFVQDERAKNFLANVLSFLKTVEFSNAESAYFYNNGIRLQVNPDRDIKAIIDRMIDLISQHEDVFREKYTRSILEKNVPDNLRDLIPYLQKYAISDDCERSQLIDTLSDKEKNELISAVTPLFEQISGYLDSFADRPLTEEAALIGNLAEFVQELINYGCRNSKK